MAKYVGLLLLLLAGPACADQAALTAAVAAACSCNVVGISFGNMASAATWTIQYGAGVTPAQQTLAQAALTANAALATAVPANPLSSLQAALIAKGVLAQSDINAAATSASVPMPTPTSGTVPTTPVP